MLTIIKIFFICVLIALTYKCYSQETETRLPELNTLVGNWNVRSENRLSSSGPWDLNTGKAVITKSTGDAIIEEDYTGILNNKTFYTKSLIAYNHFDNVFQRTFVDSEHGVLVDYQGEKKGDTLIFNKLWHYPNGSTVKLRVSYTLISPDEFKIVNMRMPDNNSGWDTTGKMDYIRAK
jgi:hypothetical protein